MAKVPGYIIAQILGGIAGAALVYWAYHDAISAFEAGADPPIVRDGGAGSIGIFVTGPAAYIDNYGDAFLSEAIGTAFLLIFVFAVVDLMNLPPRANLAPLIIGLAVFAIGMSFGASTGYAINPARDLGPRILAAMEGWGAAAFPGEQGNLDAYWWIPIAGPIVGAIIGCILYEFFISYVLRSRHKPEAEGLEARGRDRGGGLLMKKLINATDAVVAEALRGFEAAHSDIVRVNHDPAYIVRADAPVKGKVGVVSGGGSGHEPMHGGFVGMGMLDAACPGEVFTSPTPDQMHEATKAVDGGAGVLHIVKNYTGDVLNFEMAADLARAEGIEVEAVVTDDDVAVQDSLYTAGRRGVGVTVLAEKIVGAAAEEGRSLSEVAEICRRVNAQGRSMGMALTSCTVPAAGSPTFELGEDEMEIGIGIHGEPGRERVPLAPAQRDHRDAGGPDPRRPALPIRRRGPGLRQRHGRDPAARALHRLQRAARRSSTTAA